MDARTDGWPVSSASLLGGRTVGVRWQPSRGVLRTRLLLILVLLDLTAILTGFLIAAVLCAPGGAAQGVLTGFALVPVYGITALKGGAYSVSVIDRRSAGVACALRAAVFAAGTILFVAFYLRATADFSRAVFAVGTILTLFGLALGRGVFLRNARAIIGGNPYNVVVLCEGGVVPQAIGGGASTMVAASGFDPEGRDPMMYDRLAVALRKADRVVVTCAAERRHAWVHALQGANVQGEVLVPELAGMRPLGVARFGPEPTLIVAAGPLDLGACVVKRLFDAVAAAAALFLLAPLFAAVALAIRLETPGPVFFVQRRIGQANRMFRMLKFRSMRVEGCDGDGNRSAARDDDRITRVGRFLRHTSLDELPQLVNVLAGSMSIVGPRPHALGSRAGDQLFWEVDDRYWHRHAVKPGLTGLAQVRGYRGATHHQSDLLNRLQSDLEYLHGWTIWRDLLIVLQTFRVLIHRNAF